MRQDTVEPLLDLGYLPFHIGVTDVPSNGDLPDVLPFVVGVRRDIDLLVQLPNFAVQQYLEQTYRRGCIVGTPMSEEGFGRRYTDDFLTFIFRTVQPESVKGLRVLEIGCGSGYLLYRLKELGANVLGIEPGEQGQAGAQKYGIEIVRSIFPNDHVHSKGRFDLIVHYAVLEHSLDPVYFLEKQCNCLSESGMIIFSVPDCTEYVRKGDVSMFLHEHWSYFSANSLKSLVESVDLRLLRLERARFGGSLYVVAGRTGESIATKSDADALELVGLRAKNGIANAGEFFERAARYRHSTGVFCAARAINLLHLIKPKKLPRFFDDDLRIHRKYYPPFNVSVESRTSLLNKPVDELVIMSRSFGTQLKAEFMKEDLSKEMQTILADEILSN